MRSPARLRTPAGNHIWPGHPTLRRTRSALIPKWPLRWFAGPNAGLAAKRLGVEAGSVRTANACSDCSDPDDAQAAYRRPLRGPHRSEPSRAPCQFLPGPASRLTLHPLLPLSAAMPGPWQRSRAAEDCDPRRGHLLGVPEASDPKVHFSARPQSSRSISLKAIATPMTQLTQTARKCRRGALAQVVSVVSAVSAGRKRRNRRRQRSSAQRRRQIGKGCLTALNVAGPLPQLGYGLASAAAVRAQSGGRRWSGRGAGGA